MGETLTEHQCFIVEAALNHGFVMVNDDGSLLQCTERQLCDLIEAYMNHKEKQ
jgi:hypothetical protein